MRTFKNVVLIGFMGVGKTSCGEKLAHMLTYEFLDTDHYIVKQEGMSIPKIFDAHGEAYFRQCERRFVTEVFPTLQRTVIATGGGMGANLELLNLLRERAYIVHLHVPLDELIQRLLNSSGRPLVKTADPRRDMKALFAKRLPIYRTADLEILTVYRSIYSTVRQMAFYYERQLKLVNHRSF